MSRAAALLALLLLCACAADEPAAPATRTAATPRDSGPRPPFRFVDVGKAAGLDVVQVTGAHDADYIIDTIGSGGAWLDYDDDGDPDLYLAQGATDASPGPPDRLLRNDGDRDGDGVPSFTDVTTAAGLGDTSWSFGVAVADYDDDGDPDIYLANWGPNRLYRNNGDGTFSEIGAAAGVVDPSWSVSAAWSDVDHDGDLDLYVVNYVEFDYKRYPRRGQPGRHGEAPCTWRGIQVCCGPRNLEPGADHFYRNDGDADGDGIPTFTDRTEAAGLRTEPEYYGLSAVFADLDDDGDDDLYVANDSVVNTYFINHGDGTFEEAGVLAGLAYNEQGHPQASMGLAAFDYNDDGRLDLAVTNFSHDHDTLYRNEGNGTFTDVSFPAGLGGVSWFTLAWGIVPADLDQDGREELFVAHGHVYPQVDEHETGTSFHQRNSIFRQVDGARYVEVTDEAGPGLEPARCSRALLPADVDGDGDLDFLVTHMNDVPSLLRNDGAPGHWLQVRLQGTRSNRDGIGARVVVDSGGHVQQRPVTRTGSFAGSILPIAHFGVGSAATIDRLTVRWPSGATTVQEHVQPDQLLVVRE